MLNIGADLIFLHFFSINPYKNKAFLFVNDISFLYLLQLNLILFNTHGYTSF